MLQFRRWTALQRVMNRRCFSQYNNVSPQIESKIGRNLHMETNHPLCIIKNKINDHFATTHVDENGQPLFTLFDDKKPIVSTTACFDDLRIPPEHVSRAPSDTFYYNETTLLRPHTSAHQTELMRAGHTAFLCAGDCYRRDEIDRSHYPVFHQMEGVRLWDKDTVTQEFVLEDLKATLIGLIHTVFGKVPAKWVDAYFPFTDPSLELEIDWQGEELEVLGSGVIHPDVLKTAGCEHKVGWAFGLGLERLAMVLFGIPDIRLFWTSEPRFTKQFNATKQLSEMQFVPFSRYPPVFKDFSFWVDPSLFQPNDLAACVRDIAGDIVEELKLIDDFTNPKTNQTSYCFRVTFRSMERSLTDEEVNECVTHVRSKMTSLPGILELR